jgi:predicted nucleic acid-binding protein
MNLVDSSGWLSFFANTKNATRFAPPLQARNRLIVPTIVMYEVCKVLLREKGEEAAIFAQAYMQEGNVVTLTADLAVNASAISINRRLPMADSIILSTALAHQATLWTQDVHFKRMTNVRYFPA